MQFELADLTKATISNVNVRSEMHGGDHKPAMDVKISATLANPVLDQFERGLLQMLYKPAGDAPEAQGTLEGVAPVSDWPRLRSSILGPLKLKKEYVGYTLTIQHGIDDTTAIVLGGCKVNNFTIDAKEGGSVVLSFRVQASDVSAEHLGMIGALTQQEVSLTLAAPVQQDLLVPAPAEIPISDIEKAEAATKAFIEAGKE